LEKAFRDYVDGERDAWQPIETAPKDELILGYSWSGMIVSARYNHNNKRFENAVGHWIEFDYWQPLPKPPKGKEYE
jgi:hypothetical protein